MNTHLHKLESKKVKQIIYTTTMKDINALIKELDQPIQGKADWRKYRCFQLLSNGITVCCVNDITAKSTAVATTVNVGAAYDPRTISGLARTYVVCID
jgi:secreted Zn-dependent insulinase-like peptidase